MALKRRPPLLAQVLQKIAPKIGARVVMEPDWKIAGQIIFKNRRKCYFRYSSLDVNHLGSAEIAKDKEYAAYFMKRLGYPTIIGKAFFSDRWAATIGSDQTLPAAYRYAQRLGFPVIVKPNSQSQGVGVALVYTKKEFYEAMREVFVHDRVALVQEYVSGHDYRIVVLDGMIISAYERMPLMVVGDGASTITELLRKKQRMFKRTSRDTHINMDDPRIARKLRHSGLSFHSVPAQGVTIPLLDNANLSTGGDAHEVTERIHPAYKQIAIRLTRDMGLRMCGVDLMTQGEITKKPTKYRVIEVNAAPGLDHYAHQGKEQRAIVEDMYLQVLRSMEKTAPK